VVRPAHISDSGEERKGGHGGRDFGPIYQPQILRYVVRPARFTW
jgi:hypothetical protein